MSHHVLDAAGVTTPAVVVEKLHDAERASTACASAMVAGGGMEREVLLALDCADLCSAAARVLGRRAADRAVAETAAAAALRACEASAAACGAHADHHEHCRLHAETTTETAAVLREHLGI
ncbi:Ferredoxin [Pseudonocardia sp. Ae168_Ps1]|uniref:hypothetical protein n=1 Tax=unclassified Pseudonocardia TaxID=2619320 RepID=UPI00094B7108|nr:MULTISPECIES: hypothetical protein [unclassified Pseudonocardia]OLL74441.1 Ferredoxin [Pseudonocardia sp. Ae150A_Ps1]OLL80421.1 Ferredoxin [Pseudonocardia sp. Ae168_Ps1]OLL85452.1 Ferredoxin [Pseudonocardia sp. Ae263_Ps1]OLL94521.1 Ferredoxin [Pseudonocardia sp. Ae356_Ps1]OLM20983.1 Ferredoxin [Pseudonocardia sp. Ae707_Ps1]